MTFVFSRRAQAWLLGGMVALSPLAALAQDGQAATTTLRYEIRMEGDPIGTETVTVANQGPQRTVTVETTTEAQVLFFTFHYTHQRTEQWADGQLTAMTAHTDDDGTVTDLAARALTGAGWHFTVNGTASERGEQSLPLTLWTSAVIQQDHLFSVIDAAPYAVQVAALGAEPLAIGSRTAEAQHYKMTGDVSRELWFDDEGHLLRTTFTRKGYPIEIVRVF
jgi:hypothetical protein